MTFPVSPTNGQITVLNGINYQYANTTNSWTRVAGVANTLSVSGNIIGSNFTGLGAQFSGNLTSNNVVVLANISATGNIVSNSYFIGNGAFLTGISGGGGGGGGSSIANGATNINIPVSSGNIAMSIAGQPNTVVINLGSFTMYGAIATPANITSNIQIAPNVNGILFGPVSFSNSSNINIDPTSRVYVYGSVTL